MRIDTERFEVERVVGSGSMGTVFRARDRDSGAMVAMKVMRNDHAGRTARFEREAEVLAHLEHPAIVRYVGHGVTAHGERFLVMEWLEGESLKSRIGRAGLTLAETLVAGTRVAEGLAAAHHAGIVHRDVKPTNLMLVDRRVERIVLIDFGVASWQSTEALALTQTGDVIGTPAYMAPEQAAGRKVGPAADVFGLGCVLYECATGRPPFVVARHALSAPGSSAAAPRVRALRPEIPAPVADVIERLIARDLATRPADGAAALAALRELAAVDVSDIGVPARTRRAEPADRTAVPLGTAEGTGGGFADLEREHGSAPPSLSPLSAETLAVLSRHHVPMPLAVLRSQCERLGVDPHGLGQADLAAVANALADAVGRFTQPATRARVLAELRALAGKTG